MRMTQAGDASIGGAAHRWRCFFLLMLFQSCDYCRLCSACNVCSPGIADDRFGVMSRFCSPGIAYGKVRVMSIHNLVYLCITHVFFTPGFFFISSRYEGVLSCGTLLGSRIHMPSAFGSGIERKEEQVRCSNSWLTPFSILLKKYL